jgi:triosephosphate isomerase (TIM)
MTPDVRPLVAGNWKMNGLSASLVEVEAMRRAADAGEAGVAELLVCPPATLLAQAAWKLKGGKLGLGAQDCHPEASGAFTGDISAPMLKDAGAAYVIVGHSERRTHHHETDQLVRAKAEAALKAGLTPIICIGETQAEREAGRQAAVVIRQLRRSLPPGATSETVVIAYEPVWAIGTGLTPTPGDIAVVHNGLRALLTEIGGPSSAKTRILYGGSVKPANARELLELDNVDGALVGGASLKATDFLAIAAVYR